MNGPQWAFRTISVLYPCFRLDVENVYKNIKELQVGELVWAWHEETGDLALKPVLQTMVREADALVELQVGADTVQATPEHPFWANGAWTGAGDLVKGDELLRSDRVASVARSSTSASSIGANHVAAASGGTAETSGKVVRPSGLKRSVTSVCCGCWR